MYLICKGSLSQRIIRLKLIKDEKPASISMSESALNIRPLSNALQKKAIEELNEVPERISEDIAALRSWIEKQPHLKARTSDQFLVTFLRGCKYSIEKAKKKIDHYYTLRTNLPDLFQTFVDEQKALAIIRLGVGLNLPLPLEEDGPRIILVRTGHYSPDEFNFYDIMKLSLMGQDLQLINDDNAVISGFIQLLDFSKFTTSHFFHMNPPRMARLSHYAEEALPMRMRGSHFFNTGAGFETVFSTIKPLLPAKVQERMFVHANLESLYEKIPQKYLPKEYGGENGTIDEIIAIAEENFLKYRDYFLEEKNYGTNESLRVGPAINLEAIFGVDGSFRKLNVD